MKPSKKIGRIVTMKYGVIGLAIIRLIPVLYAIHLYYFGNFPLIVGFPADWVKAVLAKVLIHIFLALGAVYLCGGISGKAILDLGRDAFWTSFVCLLIFWLILLFGHATIEGFTPTYTDKSGDFFSNFFTYLSKGIVLYVLVGIIHGLTLAHFMGKEIIRRGKRSGIYSD